MAGRSVLIIDDENSVYFVGVDSYQKIEVPPIARVLKRTGAHYLLIDQTGSVWTNNLTEYTNPIKLQIPAVIENGCYGFQHAILLDNVGGVWVCGMNFQGQLGTGNTNEAPNFVKLDLQDIVSVAAAAHSLFLDKSGTVWDCGSNDFGQLGQNHKTSLLEPTQVLGLPAIKAISCGMDHSIFLAETGEVWVCGKLTRGSDIESDVFNVVTVPHKLTNIPPITKIASGNNHGMLIDQDQKVWAIGGNYYGLLGLGDFGHRNAPEVIKTLPPISFVLCSLYNTFFIDVNSDVWACGDLEPFPKQPLSLFTQFTHLIKSYFSTPIKLAIRVKTIQEDTAPTKSARFVAE